jgi:hypothetical protein
MGNFNYKKYLAEGKLLKEDKNIFKDVIEFLKSTGTYMTIYDEGDVDEIMLQTRTNGDIGSETVGPEDVEEAQRVKKILHNQFPNLRFYIEEVDEWVHLSISPPKVDQYSYTLTKRDDSGGGFDQTFDTMDELIEKYGDWVNVNWGEIKTHVETINQFPNDQFTGWYKSEDYLISKAGTPGNDLGYNFYISKNKR